MLQAHMRAQEQRLLASSRISANSGHNLHKGTPREAFIREFLQYHMSETIGIGTGEIIDCNSKPNEKRNQIDIVLYRRSYPKLDFGGGITCFLAESVIAIIEVKSELTEVEMGKSIEAAKNVKALSRSLSFIANEFQPPSILCYVVAYDGPASMKTVVNWFPDLHKASDIELPPMPPTNIERYKVASPGVDGVFVLGKGFIQFDNSPSCINTQDKPLTDPRLHWNVVNTKDTSLLMLFLALTTAANGCAFSWFNPTSYTRSFEGAYCYEE